MPKTNVAKKISEPVSSRYDDRAGLGYGVLKNRFHNPRQSSNSFPYIFDEFAEEIKSMPEDEESSAAIAKKVHKPLVTDPLAHKSVNPFYYAAGNTKLSDCFFRTATMLEQIAALGLSLIHI